MARYGPRTQKEIEEEIRKHKHEGKWKNKKQAIAVGISKARKKGFKVPPEKG